MKDVMKAKWVKAIRTPVTPYEAVSGFRKACKRLWNTDRPETVAVLTAQSALESGRWAAMWNFNPSNIKASAAYEGLYCTIKLNEQLRRGGKLIYVWFSPLGELTSKNGTIISGTESEDPPGHAQCRMRAFDRFDDGLLDKLAFLNKPHWARPKTAALAGNPAEYVHWCKDLGYFTADLVPYQRSVVSLFKTFLPIARAQQVEPEPLPLEDEEQLCLDMAACMRVDIPEWLRVKVAQIQSLNTAQMQDAAAEEVRRARDAAIAAKDYS